MAKVASSGRNSKPASGSHRDELRVTVAGVRLASGLVLFAYTFAHLFNHALGNISLVAMEQGLTVVAGFWSLLPPQIVLYAAFTAHLGLGLWALYLRRPFRYRPTEAFQLGLGLLIPFLLLDHIVASRLGAEIYGLEGRYVPYLYSFFIGSPAKGVEQALTLVVVWAHGCIGLYYWLRLKPFYPRIAPFLLAGAVLVPTLSLLGYVQGGREVMRLAADPAWRLPQFPPSVPPDVYARLARISSLILWGYGALIVLVLLARLARLALSHRAGLVSVTYPDGRVVRVPQGSSVLEASKLNHIPHVAVCGGKGRCSTCRVRIVASSAPLPAPSAAEKLVLERIKAGDGVRLACQLRPKGDVTIAQLVASNRPRQQALHQPAALGEERFVVAMFVDMRGSTRLAEHRLPFDTVFLINRFLEAVGGGVAASGGAPNQFLGDGMMALFGLTVGREEAARQAIAAVGRVAERVAALNEALHQHLDEPIRYGIGLHAGQAILGEIGDRMHGGAVFTAIGDAVNVASRLQSMTKKLGVEAIVSEAVFQSAGEEPNLPKHEIEVEGRQGRLCVRTIEKAAGLLKAS